MHQNRAAEGESLPPITGSLTPHILQPHYKAMIWRQAGEGRPSLPSPVECGWNFNAAACNFFPILCLNPPPPEAIVNLVKCGCKHVCKMKCSCLLNNIPCTEVCGCVRFSCSHTVCNDEQVGSTGDDDA